MAKNLFLKNAFKLTIITLLMRGVGTVFMIFIANKIGAEGVGLYQLTFSIYYLFTTLATSGISLAVTRIVSEKVAINDNKSAIVAFKYCLFLSIILSIISSILLFSFSPNISNILIKDNRVILPLKILSIGLPFLSVASCIRGYFLGLKSAVKSSMTDVIEQVTQIIITCPLLIIFGTKSIENACLALIIGSTASEFLSCIYGVILYFKNKLIFDKNSKNNTTNKSIFKKILSIIIPIALSSYVRSILTTLENILVPTGLKKFGQSSQNSLAQYGLIKGMVLPILYFPSAILSAFASLLVPEISQAAATNSQTRIVYITNRCIKMTLSFSVFITTMFFIYSNQIGQAIFGNSQVGVFLKFFAPLVILMYLDIIVDSILKGLNQQVSSMKYNTLDSIIRASIIFFLVPIMGIKGFVIMLYVGTIFNALLSFNRL
ncbi:MAG: oligosaccharide flippase family protein, partial [Oscillospiraceae bacterium]